jgi:hypothetical protein
MGFAFAVHSCDDVDMRPPARPLSDLLLCFYYFRRGKTAHQTALAWEGGGASETQSCFGLLLSIVCARCSAAVHRLYQIVCT